MEICKHIVLLLSLVCSLRFLSHSSIHSVISVLMKLPAVNFFVFELTRRNLWTSIHLPVTTSSPYQRCFLWRFFLSFFWIPSINIHLCVCHLIHFYVITLLLLLLMILPNVLSWLVNLLHSLEARFSPTVFKTYLIF